jgi:hypothetical protein
MECVVVADKFSRFWNDIKAGSVWSPAFTSSSPHHLQQPLIQVKVHLHFFHFIFAVFKLKICQKALLQW